MTAVASQCDFRPGVGAMPGLFEEIIVDLFAGGGGMSLGIEHATGRCVDEAVNHDADAIWMHRMNHPNTRHHRDSVWRLDPLEVSEGRPVGLLHGSPDCCHFSVARGGKPVRKEIRGLAWCVLRWTAKLRPRILTMENVREFLTWCPLVQKRAGRNRWLWEITRAGAKGKRIRHEITGPHKDDGSARRWIAQLESLGYALEPMMIPDRRRVDKQGFGAIFKQWLRQLRALGYEVEWRVLDAANYGAPTHRRRLFIVARRDGRSIRWPEPTHGPGRAIPYRTAAECIERYDDCPSIFGRKKDLADNTLRRICRGLVKFTIETNDPHIVRVDHGFGLVSPYTVGAGGRSPDPRELFRPLGTILPRDWPCLVAPHIVRCAHGEVSKSGARRWGSGAHDIFDPLGTVTGSNDYAVASAFFYDRYGERAGGGNLVVPYLYEHANSTWSTGSWCVVAPLCVKYYGCGENVLRADGPVDTITGRDRFGMVAAHLTKLRGSGGWSNPAKPLDVICAGATTFGLTAAKLAPWVVKHYGGNYTGAGIDARSPMDTITAVDHHALGVAFISHLRGTHGYGIGGSGLSMGDCLPTITGGRHLYLTTGAIYDTRGTTAGEGGGRWDDRESGNRDIPGGGVITQPDRFCQSVRGDHRGQRPDGSGGTARLRGDRAIRVGDQEATIFTPRELMGPSDNPAINRGFWRVYDLLRKYLGPSAPLPIVRKREPIGHEGSGMWRTVEYPIHDIGMRMMRPRELLNAQFGPELAKDYVLTGTRENQVAKIGNSVPPLLGAAVIAANWRDTEIGEVAA